MSRNSVAVLATAAAVAVLAACAGTMGTATTGGTASAGGARVALVIGQSAYDNVPTLPNPLNDANDMCAALKQLGFRTLCHTNLRDRNEFDARIGEYLALLGPRSVGVVYYSGHGVQANGANFLIPTQVQPKSATADPTSVLYKIDDLFDRLQQKPTQFQFVILDACRTDLLGRAPAASANSTRQATRSALLRSLDLVPGAASGLQRINDAPPNTLVLYATASRDTAYDGEGRNGPLTQHLLRHIGTQGLFVEDLIKRVTQGVRDQTARTFGKGQIPYSYGSFPGRFCFAGCPGDRVVPVQPNL